MKKRFKNLSFVITLLFLLSGFSQIPIESGLFTPFHAQKIAAQNSNPLSWSYEGETGPEYWGKLDPSFAACEKGREQSPIHIQSSQIDGQKKVNDIKGQYKPVHVQVKRTEQTLKANLMEANNKLKIDDREYHLEQFHFHLPSEHLINGRQYPMELHFVHQDEDKKLAVLGVMIEEGKENEEIASLLKSLEHDGNGIINIQKLIPNRSKVFQYHGSLTTPPCTEGVKWVVLEKPLELSRKQIEAFKENFQKNNRPLQPLNERKITGGSFTRND